MGFPDSSVHKESTCNAGDPGSIPGSGRFAGEGIGYPLQWVMPLQWQLSTLGYPFLGFPMAQLVKNLPAMWETWVQSMGWEDPLEKGKDIHFSIVVPREFYREYIENYIENIQNTIQSMGSQIFCVLINHICCKCLNFSVYLFIFFSWFLIICSYHSTCKYDSNTTYSE